jgi:hypothetical protein
MSKRYEISDADAPLEITAADDDEHGLELDRGNYALIIGDPGEAAHAIAGTPDQIRAFHRRLTAVVDQLPQ